MKRREILTGALLATLGGRMAGKGQTLEQRTEHPQDGAARPSSHYYELRTYTLRNDLQPSRLSDHVEQHLMPALQRAGVGPVGAFQVLSGMRSPSLVLLLSHPSLAEAQALSIRLSEDRSLAAATQSLEATGQIPYVRYQSTVLRAFDGHPRLEIPPTSATRPPRLFELRVYESPTTTSLRRKIDMFNQEEIRIFRACGLAPVFFGETLFGGEMPNLTYLIGFDDMAAREKAWDTFRSHPDWLRIKGRPGWTDPEAVSNITTVFLRPAAFSQIR
jgi:hypothetical protein